MSPSADDASSPAAEPYAADQTMGSTLLVRMRENDPEAWRRINYLFGPVIEQWCRRSGLQGPDAADVAQEVFRTVVAHREDFRRERRGDTFRGWLWTVTQSKIKDFWRRRAKQPAADGGTAHLEFVGQLADADLSGTTLTSPDDNRQLLRRSLDLVRMSFEEKTWQAFWLSTVEEKSGADVGAALGISPGAVYVAKSRVIAKLREELADFFDEGFKL